VTDEGALLTAGASAGTVSDLQSFYGLVVNLYQAQFGKNGALTHYQRGAACYASAYGRAVVIDLRSIITVPPPQDYSVPLRRACGLSPK
jgi:hypothetical protein